jgi:predicted small metal-binding protein
MKTMTCKQIGGACDLEFKAETFEEIGALSKTHAMEMHNENDEAHMEEMKKMGELMQDPADMKKWFEAKRKEFESLPDNR